MKLKNRTSLLLSFIFLVHLTSCNGNSGKFNVGDTLAEDHVAGPLEHFARSLDSIPEKYRDNSVKVLLTQYPRTPVIESDSVAGIYWYGKAEEVLITGDFQEGWSRPDRLEQVPCGENTFFYISYLLPSDARLDYQLIIDGQYMTDPRNEKITPSGYGPHSEIAMPGFRPDPARARFPDVPRGSIDSILFSSNDTLYQPRKMKVYLPAGYESMKRMPALYVMDGLEALEWMDYRNVLDNLIAWDRVRPLIVVFIPPVDRGGEFMEDIYELSQDVLCQEIVPMIDARYRTDARAKSRGITGISAGGFFALMTVLERSDVFACGAGQSPAITQEVHSVVQANSKKLKKNKDLRVYFDMGRYDLPAGLLGNDSFFEKGKKLHLEMVKLDIEHEYFFPNDGHEWANWRERLGTILVYFFGKQ